MIRAQHRSPFMARARPPAAGPARPGRGRRAGEQGVRCGQSLRKDVQYRSTRSWSLTEAGRRGQHDIGAVEGK